LIAVPAVAAGAAGGRRAGVRRKGGGMRGRAVFLVSIAGVLAMVLGGTGVTSQQRPSGGAVSGQQAAQHLLQSPYLSLTPAARQALQRIATGDDRFGASQAPAGTAGAPSTGGRAASGRSDLTNVPVNSPAGDTREDQTTQSETSVAVSGQNVVVGYNDSQQTLLYLTAASDLSGVARSADGGATFQDEGTIPNAPGTVNVGDPWVGADRTGRFFYATLQESATVLGVAVSRSMNGGQTWANPRTVSPNSDYYFGDKDALTVGPDPQNPEQDDVYAAWDDFVFNEKTGTQVDGLPVSHSYDGGKTWHVSYAGKIKVSFFGCSFGQFFGAQPMVDASNGTLYVTAQRIDVVDPDCSGGTIYLKQLFYTSTDGGRTFSKPVKISDDTSPFPTDVIVLAPGQYMRTADFPTMAQFNGALYVAWNDKGSGKYHIRLASSTDGGQTWTTAYVTSGEGDEVQPALSADASGLHLAYYQRNQDNTLDVMVADSTDGSNFTTSQVTSQPFPGVYTDPQFDPIIAWDYMGDYIANVSDGAHQYFAWGDNRNVVTTSLWPNGRHDPDVFFAKR
jgi:hypothetical protein